MQKTLFPLYEEVGGTAAQTVKTPSRKPVEEYLKLQGRFAHLGAEEIAAIQAQVDAAYGEMEKRLA